MAHIFKHLLLINRHRHRVILNGARCGIFWHCLKHDLSKYGPTEFFTSAKYYNGHHSPVFEERLDNAYFSKVCQHHTRRNPHHWEYWLDWFMGHMIIKTMPWVYATEYVCDMLSASYCYDPKGFKPGITLDYFVNRKDHYYLTRATEEYVIWCLTRFATLGFKGLKKKDTKVQYQRIIAKYPLVETRDRLHACGALPSDPHEVIMQPLKSEESK